MIRLFKHYIPHAVLLLGLLDVGLLVLASEVAWRWRAHQIAMTDDPRVVGEAIPFCGERDMFTPEITGWAQIGYPYGATVEDSRCKLEYDLYHTKNYTPFLAFVILWPEGAR